MLASSLLHRLVRPTFQTVRFTSSDVTAASAASVMTHHDLALEKRRAARLTRESLSRKRSEAAALGIAPGRTYVPRSQYPMSAMVSASATILNGFPTTPMRPRRPLEGGQRSPVERRGKERSRAGATIANPAGSIRDFSAREATKRAERAGGAGKTRDSENDEDQKTQSSKGGAKFVDENDTQELPQFMAPEPVTSDLASALDKVPNIASPLPSMPPTHKKLSPGWLKCTYGGDYSKYQLDTQDYLRGTRGVGHLYARIVLERNGSLSQDSRKKLHWFIQKATRGPRPNSMA